MICGGEDAVQRQLSTQEDDSTKTPSTLRRNPGAGTAEEGAFSSGFFEQATRERQHRGRQETSSCQTLTVKWESAGASAILTSTFWNLRGVCLAGLVFLSNKINIGVIEISSQQRFGSKRLTQVLIKDCPTNLQARMGQARRETL